MKPILPPAHFYHALIYLIRHLAWILSIGLLFGLLKVGIPAASVHGWAGDAPPTTPVCPPSIGYGETIQCSIDSAAETDTYTFSASAGDKILVRMSKTSGEIWPKIRVNNPSSVMLCDTYSTASAEISTCTLPTSGTYSIWASDYFGTELGEYYLYLQRLNNPGSTAPIAFGETLPDAIFTPSEFDTYTFSANAGDKVLLRMSVSSGELWPEVRVYNPAGTKICDNYSTVSAEIASCSLATSGAYTILAHDYFGTDLGDYYIYLQRLNNPGSTVAIAFGETLSGAIYNPAEFDAFTFDANAGDKVLLRMSVSSGELWPEVRVYNPAGTKICENYSTASTEIATCTLTNAGTYTILAHDYFGTELGDYYLYLQRVNNPGSALAIVFGEILIGAIGTPAEFDAFTFNANAGDKVLLRMSVSSGEMWPEVRVYNPAGTKICENYSTASTEIATCTLTNAGTYTILAHDYFGKDLGDYYLYLQRLNNPGRAVAIAFGESLSGAILTPAEFDAYTFTADAGDKVLLRMSVSSGEMWPEVRVYNPAGTKICENYSTLSAEIASCSLTSDGTYTLLAHNYFGTELGDYYIYIQRLNNPGLQAAVLFGETLFETIATSAEFNTFTFSASAGDKVLVRMSVSSGEMWPEVRLYNSNGAMVCDTYSTTTAEIGSCSLATSGTYTLLAHDYFGTEMGEYALFLQRLNNPGSPFPINIGQVKGGSILTPATADSYTFTANAGIHVLVKMSRLFGEMWPEVRVYSPDGVKICSTYGTSTAEIPACALPTAGTYTILALDYFGTGTGTYSLCLDCGKVYLPSIIK